MIQEIITYMLVGAALTLAILKMRNKFRPKQVKSEQPDLKKEAFRIQHNCSDCSAECMLRNSPSSLITKNKDLCKKIEI